LASVVIPTRDRPESLQRCLAAVRDQAAEIVVADDGSADAERVASIAAGAGARVIRLEGNGPAAARNAGARTAGGEVICFTDDDCEPAPGWVAALTAPIRAEQAGCTAGLTRVADDASAADRAWQAIANHLQRTATEPGSPSPGFAPTCNLACSRELLRDLPFDESFPAAAGEDRDWAARAAARDSAPRFVPTAIVTHRPQLDATTFLRQQYRYGRGAASFRATNRDRRLGPPSFYLGLLRVGFSAGLGPGTLVVAAQLATAAGIAAERRGGTSRAGGYSNRRPD
jgi:glycosyltransferase involved in cell wall biosynthesis